MEGPFDFHQVGILKQVLDPLAEVRIVIMAIEHARHRSRDGEAGAVEPE